MRTRALGNSDPSVTAVGFGAWDGADRVATTREAIDLLSYKSPEAAQEPFCVTHGPRLVRRAQGKRGNAR